MEIVRRRLRAAAWVALVVMGALALLPTLAHARAFGAGSGTHWAEVCTPQGVRWVAAETIADVPAAPVSAAGHLEHCPWCQPAHADAALLLDGGERPVSAPAAEGHPWTAHSGIRAAAPPWRPGQPRAPPQHGSSHRL